MKLFLRVCSVIALLAFSLLVIIFLLDAIGVLSDPEEYRLAQGFTEPVLTSSSPSVLKYVGRSIGIALIAIVGVILNVRYIRGRLNPSMVKVYWGVVIASAALVIAGYLQWMSTGYDH